MNRLSLITKKQLFYAIIPVMAFFLIPGQVQALEIKDAAVEIRDDFVLEPAKIDVSLKPGASTTKTLSVVNRTDKEQTFTIEIEDFTGSKDPNQAVVLLGTDRGPYSLKDFIKPEVKSFKLKSKQRAVIGVDISIPVDAEPGGRYASVLVSTASSTGPNTSEDNKARTISRIGALYFVGVEGPVTEQGKLTDFRLVGPSKPFYEKGPFNFETLFENTGNIHLAPSGKVEIKNLIGQKVQSMDVVPFFSLPDSLRASQVSWDPGFAFGRYTATVTLDRGYRTETPVIDTMTLSFWVLPWKIMLGLLIALVVIIFILRKLYRNFEIRKR